MNMSPCTPGTPPSMKQETYPKRWNRNPPIFSGWVVHTKPQLTTNGNIAHSNVNSIIGAIEAGRANEFLSGKSEKTMVSKADKVITRVDVNGDVVVLSTVSAVDNDDNTRTYNVTVKVCENGNDTAVARGVVTVAQ